jgi:CrcB protein
MDYLWVGVGGGIGAIARFFVGKKIVEQWGSSFPYATLLINISGAIVIGFLVTMLTERNITDPFWRTLLVVGFLGGYTTFSSYTWEAMHLFEEGRWPSALAYIGLSNTIGLGCCALGIILARATVA